MRSELRVVLVENVSAFFDEQILYHRASSRIDRAVIRIKSDRDSKEREPHDSGASKNEEMAWQSSEITHRNSSERLRE